MARIETKWPLLLVEGEAVTEMQAEEIILRTCGGYFIGNDRAWERQIHSLLGIVPASDDRRAWAAVSSWYDSIGGLNLSYLVSQRIYSASLVGPHGWCDWDGRIGCGRFNIGKWPSVEAVEGELSDIAAAWPFLRMRVQLVEHEGDGDLCGEWLVSDGKMIETEPGPDIAHEQVDWADIALRLVMDRSRERGVSAERLAAALGRVGRRDGF